MTPISIDLRRRVVEAYKNGEGGYHKLAGRFKLSWNSVRRWVALERTTQSLAPLPHKVGPDPKIPASQWADLKNLVMEKPDRTLPELSLEWNKRHNTNVHPSSMGRALIRAGMRFKKTLRASERDRTDILAKEAAFIKEIAAIPPQDLVFLDEAGAHLGMTRTHAHAPLGERAICKHSLSYQSNISMVGAIILKGICELYPYDGSIDGERFLSFLERLIPKLNPHQVVVMDNLRVHHMKVVKERFARAKIRLLYLPPYSPESNPIEEAWSIIKRILRSLEATTIAAFIEAMNLAKENVTIDKIAGFFKHAGYAL